MPAPDFPFHTYFPSLLYKPQRSTYFSVGDTELTRSGPSGPNQTTLCLHISNKSDIYAYVKSEELGSAKKNWAVRDYANQAEQGVL